MSDRTNPPASPLQEELQLDAGPKTVAEIRDGANELYRRALRTSQLASAYLIAERIRADYPDAAILTMDPSDLDDGFMGGDILAADGSVLVAQLESIDDDGELQDVIYDLPQRPLRDDPAYRWLTPAGRDDVARLDIELALSLTLTELTG